MAEWLNPSLTSALLVGHSFSGLGRGLSLLLAAALRGVPPVSVDVTAKGHEMKDVVVARVLEPLLPSSPGVNQAEPVADDDALGAVLRGRSSPAGCRTQR